MGHLGGQVEDDVAARDEALHRRGVPDVGGVDFDLGADFPDVGEVAAVALDEGVAQSDVRALLEEPSGEVRADETEAPGHQDTLSGERSHTGSNHSTAPHLLVDKPIGCR